MNPFWKHIPTTVTQIVGRSMLQTSKHSPTILFVGGIVGVVATTVMASRATLQLSETLEESKKDLEIAKSLIHKEDPRYSEKDYQKDVTTIYVKRARDLTKLYGPTVIVGILSITALTKSHRILTGRNAALTAAYAALEKGFAEYRKRVVQEYGEETDRKLRHSQDFETLSGTDQDGNEIAIKARKNPNDYSVYARFFDETNRKFKPDPSANMFFLRAQQHFANDMLRERGHIFLNEVYDMIGAERTRAGSVVGWVLQKGGDNYVDFGIFDHDKDRARAFVNGYESAILLDFNVDGVIYDKI